MTLIVKYKQINFIRKWGCLKLFQSVHSCWSGVWSVLSHCSVGWSGGVAVGEPKTDTGLSFRISPRYIPQAFQNFLHFNMIAIIDKYWQYYWWCNASTDVHYQCGITILLMTDRKIGYVYWWQYWWCELMDNAIVDWCRCRNDKGMPKVKILHTNFAIRLHFTRF